MENRKIIIGDLHGCYDEALKILEQVDYNKETDQIYLVGDLIHRGLYSKACFQFYYDYNCKSVLGNHELEHLKVKSGEWDESSRVTTLKNEFGEELYGKFIAEISKWPLYIEEDEFILVHAGIPPDQSHLNSDLDILTTIRTVADPNDPSIIKPWFEFYTGEKLVVFGHWSRLGGLISKNVIGLDMGCVFGRSLRALVLPERKIVEVKALKQYYNPIK